MKEEKHEKHEILCICLLIFKFYQHPGDHRYLNWLSNEMYKIASAPL